MTTPHPTDAELEPSTLPLDELRALRTALQHEDDAISYVRRLAQARLDRPAQALLHEPGGAGVRVHLLDHAPATALIGRSPGGSAEGRASLILRRRSEDGAAMDRAISASAQPWLVRNHQSSAAK